MKRLSEKQVMALKYQDLIKYAKEVGIKYEFQTKKELQQLVIAKLAGISVENPANSEAVADEPKNKQAKIRRIEKGSSVMVIDFSFIDETARALLEKWISQYNTDDAIFEVAKIKESEGIVYVKSIGSKSEVSVGIPAISLRLYDTESKQIIDDSTIESKDSKNGKASNKSGSKRKRRSNKIRLNEEQQSIIDAYKENMGSDDAKYSKSATARKLYRANVTIGNIAKLLQIHYSFAYCVIDKFRKDHLNKEA